VTQWSFLTNHGRTLLCIARDPEVRLREIANILAISERRTYAIVTELTDAGYLVKCKEGPCPSSPAGIRPSVPSSTSWPPRPSAGGPSDGPTTDLHGRTFLPRS
jgi:hypothetical protein